MSKLLNILLVEPERFEDCKQPERLTSVGHDCPKCNGRGYFPGQKIYHNQYTEPEDCKTCQGTGKLKGFITIQWAPDHKE